MGPGSRGACHRARIRATRWLVRDDIVVIKRACVRLPAAFDARICTITSLPKNGGRRECRASGSPAASYADKESIRVSHHRSAERSGTPCAIGFNGFLRALPGEPGFLVTIPSATRKRCRRVDASIGASGPHDFTVRSPHHSSVDVAGVHRIPRPTSVTIAIRPSPRAQDAGRNARDLPDATRKSGCDELARRANQVNS
jgi:hypothetical protein